VIPRWQTLRHALAVVSALVALSAVSTCSLFQPAPIITEKIDLLAVMPIERQDIPSATPKKEVPRLAPGAEGVVTAQIYHVLASGPRWRFVPDLTVSQALGKIPPGGDLQSRARKLGEAVGADGVLCGTVFRYRERIGTEYGARQPAAVGFTLQLISVSSGRVLWTGTFSQAQKPLSANLFNWWQFWRGGPRWFTAQEFARLGVQRLLDELARQLGT
jgi:hypothetical protein